MYLITELNIALTSCGLNIKWTIHASADGLIMFLLDKSVSVHRALTRLSNRDWHWDCQTVRYWENSSQIRESKIVNHVMSMSLLLLSIFVWVCLDEKKELSFSANLSVALTGGGRSVRSLAGLLVFSENQEQRRAEQMMIHQEADDRQNYSDWNTGTVLILHPTTVTLCTPTTGALERFQSSHKNCPSGHQHTLQPTRPQTKHILGHSP